MVVDPGMSESKGFGFGLQSYYAPRARQVRALMSASFYG